MNSKINFFVCGAQKAGTTALYYMLSQIETIALPSPKELHFFDDENVDWANPDYSRLDTAFDAEPGLKHRIDITPIYMFWPDAIRRISIYNSNAKLIILLRQPAFRAYSQWMMEYSRGKEELPFLQAISEQGRNRTIKTHGSTHRVNSYIQRGYYADQMTTIYRHFPHDRVLVLRTDELWRDPSLSLNSVFEFLQIAPHTSPRARYVTPYQRKNFPPLSKSLQGALTKHFEVQIRKTANLTQLDLSDWLSPQYREPMISDLEAKERPEMP